MPIIPLRPDIEDTIEFLDDEDTPAAEDLAFDEPVDLPFVPEPDVRGAA